MHFKPENPADETMDRAINSLKNMDIRFTSQERRRLAIECRRSLTASKVPAWAMQLRGLFLFHLPQRATATAFGLVLLVAVSSLFLPSRQPSQPPGEGRGSHVQLVSIRPVRQGGVLLEWRDGDQDRFWVLKSDNPRDFSKAEKHQVVGNRWMDLDPGTGQVTYYRVE